MTTPRTDEYEVVNEAAASDWTRETTTRERIKAAITRTTEPTSVAEIAHQARASKPVVRDELTALTELGLVEKIEDGQAVRYKRNDQTYVYQQVLKLQEEYTEDELVEQLQALKQTVADIRSKHGVESPAELAQQLAPDDREGWDDHTTWQTAQKSLYLAKAALSFADASNVVA